MKDLSIDELANSTDLEVQLPSRFIAGNQTTDFLASIDLHLHLSPTLDGEVLAIVDSTILDDPSLILEQLQSLVCHDLLQLQRGCELRAGLQLRSRRDAGLWQEV